MSKALIDSIFGNKLIRDFAFGKVKEIMISENLDHIKIFINESGNIDAELVKKQNTENNGTTDNNTNNG